MCVSINSTHTCTHTYTIHVHYAGLRVADIPPVLIPSMPLGGASAVGIAPDDLGMLDMRLSLARVDGLDSDTLLINPSLVAHTHVHIHVHTHVHTHVHMHMYTCTCTRNIYTYMYTYACTYACAHTYNDSDTLLINPPLVAHTHVHMHMYTKNVHTHVHIRMDICMYTYM